MKLQRQVLPERLDAMAVADPAARRARRDLQRVHRVMRSLTILRQAIDSLHMTGQPRNILELGAGDGSLMLRFAQAARASRRAARWRDVQVTFLDRQDVIDPDTCRRFSLLDWNVQVLSRDVLEWAHAPVERHYDLCVTTLFLHHFESHALKLLLRAVASCCRTFIALEPRRSGIAWIGSHLLGVLGANEVTREDGVTSVVAGFASEELSGLWPSEASGWLLREYFAWPFTHCFVADGRGVPR